MNFKRLIDLFRNKLYESKIVDFRAAQPNEKHSVHEVHELAASRKSNLQTIERSFQRGLFRLSAIVTLMAFIMNMMMPFMAVYDVSKLQAAEYTPSSGLEKLVPVLGQKVLICTSQGFKWIDLADAQNQEHHDNSDMDYECASCYFSANSSKFGAASSKTYDHHSRAPPKAIYTNFRHSFASKVYHGYAFSSRAPPIL